MSDLPISEEALVDEDWLAAPRPQPRLRLVLVGLLAASLCFLAGALVQKHVGGTGAASPVAGGGRFPGGAPGGGAPGGGMPGASSAASGSASDASSGVIGKVVSIDGTTWVVENLGGKRQTVTVADTAKVVHESAATSSDVKVGDAVDISGTTSGKKLQASKVTLR